MSFGVVVDNPHKMAFRSLQNRALRHEDRIRTNRARYSRTHELSRLQAALRVGERCAHEERAGLRAERRVGKADMTARRKYRAVSEDDRDVEFVVRRKHQLFLRDLVAI